MLTSADIREKATLLGFDLAGIAPVGPSSHANYFRQWLAGGHHGDMHWLKNRIQERINPAVYLPGAQSVICVAVNYYFPAPSSTFEASCSEGCPKTERRTGRIARYALGDDYHEWFKPRLHALADWLRERAPDAETRCAVDTAPVMEKELAARAGVGWMGKNTCVINSKIGSWLLLGEVLTTLELAPDIPATDRCGTCTRCIEACPTRALEPYRMDARRCISYLNIELRGETPAEYRPAMGNWLFGCDICQEVCPWNRQALPATAEAFRPRWPSGGLDPAAVLQWTPQDYRRELRGSAMKRVKLHVLQRNAGIVAANRTIDDH